MMKRSRFQRNARQQQHRFVPSHIAALENLFAKDPIPDRRSRQALAHKLGVSERQVQTWLQNKRQRTKARRLKALFQPKSVEGASQVHGNEPRPTPSGKREGHMHESLHLEVFLTPHAPFQVLWASDDWLAFCGFTLEEIKGQSLQARSSPVAPFLVIN